MNADILLEALVLPTSSRVDQRVSKRLLLENGGHTAASKRLINEGMDELFWLAALKPTTVGVPEYRDDTREYLEIAVLRLTMRPMAKAARLVDLVHRAIPYPLLLLAEQDERTGLSVAHKRWSHSEAGKTVLEGDVVSIEWEGEGNGQYWPSFCEAVSLGHQPQTALHLLYQGWVDTLLAFKAAHLTGSFSPAINATHAGVRRDALQEYARCASEIARLRGAAAKEKQMSRRVDLNLEVQRIEAAKAVALAKL